MFALKLDTTIATVLLAAGGVVTAVGGALLATCLLCAPIAGVLLAGVRGAVVALALGVAVAVGARTAEQVRDNVALLDTPVPDALWHEVDAFSPIVSSDAFREATREG